jgi:hypothetical protein
MTVTAALVNATPNNLRYLITSDVGGGTVVIANAAGATPDLQTDSVVGPIKRIARARVDGIGTIAPLATITAAQSRAMLLADGTSSIGNANVPRAVSTLQVRSGLAVMSVDATVDGSTNPTLTVTSSAAVGVAYLDIQIPGAIG